MRHRPLPRQRKLTERQRGIRKRRVSASGERSDQQRLLRLGHDSHPRPHQDDVVQALAPRRRLLHRELARRYTLHTDASMPHAPRRRQDTFRHLRLFARRLIIQSHIYRHAADRMCMASPRRPTARPRPTPQPHQKTMNTKNTKTAS